MEVIGAALLGAVNRLPHRQLADRLHVPMEDTIKDWLRRARHGASALIGHAILLARQAGAVAEGRLPCRRGGKPVSRGTRPTSGVGDRDGNGDRLARGEAWPIKIDAGRPTARRQQDRGTVG